MSKFSQIHWHEGLFLRPHHLQMLQRRFLERFGEERLQSFAFPHGVVASQVSPDALQNFRVQFEKLHVIMPSGRELSVPDVDELAPLDIKDDFASGGGDLIISLAIPLWGDDCPNAVEPESSAPGDSKHAYRVSDLENVFDENTGANPQAIRVRRLNARLVVDDPSARTSRLEFLPVLKLHRAPGSVGLPEENPRHYPPCFVLAGHSGLIHLVRELADQIDSSRKKLAQTLREGFDMENCRGSELRRLLKLSTLGRIAGRLQLLVRCGHAVTPLEAYQELRGLHGELEGLYPEHGTRQVAGYDHDNLFLSFSSLDERIRDPYLRDDVPDAAKEVAFEFRDGALMAELEPADFDNALRFYLRVTGGNQAEVSSLVTNGDRFKVMPRDDSFSLIPGVPMYEERNTPVELPRRTEYLYFRLAHDENERMWGRIRDQGCIALFWQGVQNSPLEFQLCVTFPTGSSR